MRRECVPGVSERMERFKTVWDMETGDPDDAMTLCVLATHPRVDLLGVTVFPGGQDQVGLAKDILSLLGRSDVPVGAGQPKKAGDRVGGFYRKWLGDIEPSLPDGTAVEVIHTALRLGATHLITGAALTNPYQAMLSWDGEFFDNWTCQGGFAGDNVVPPQHRLPKFAGRVTCPTFNLNGDVKAALALIDTPRIRVKHFVTKNVCHGIFYNESTQLPDGAHPGLDLLKRGMRIYMRDHAGGKPLHDCIAAAAAIDPTIIEWVDGHIYRERGEWGTKPGSHKVSIALDVPAFERTLAG